MYLSVLLSFKDKSPISATHFWINKHSIKLSRLKVILMSSKLLNQSIKPHRLLCNYNEHFLCTSGQYKSIQLLLKNGCHHDVYGTGLCFCHSNCLVNKTWLSKLLYIKRCCCYLYCLLNITNKLKCNLSKEKEQTWLAFRKCAAISDIGVIYITK